MPVERPVTTEPARYTGGERREERDLEQLHLVLGFPGLTLGDAEVRLDELVAAYAAFARGGTLMTPKAVRDGNAPAEGRLLASGREHHRHGHFTAFLDRKAVVDKAAVARGNN